MFADALLDSHHNSRRGWATLTSFGLQAVMLAGLLIVPLFYAQVLPRIESVAHVVAPPLGQAPIPPNQHATAPSGGGPSIFTIARANALAPPQRIPHGTNFNSDVSAPEIPIGVGSGINSGFPDGVWQSVGRSNTVLPPQQTVQRPSIVHLSKMTPGSLLYRVEPQYPPICRTANIQGTVVLVAIIGRDGTIQKLHVVSGQPQLAQAALDAVREWRYRPYILNDAPVEVETQITVSFLLSR